MTKSPSYWDKRAISRMSDAEKISDEYIERIKKMYDKAYRNIDMEINNVYENYAKDTGLNISKLKELLTKNETDKIWKTLKKQGLDQYIKDNYKSRISRLEQIQAQIYAKAKLLYPKEEFANTMCYKGIINNSYYKSIYDIQMGTGYDFVFNKIDNNLLEVLLNEKWSGSNYSQRIWKNTDILATNLCEVIGGALLSGQDIEKTSRQIKERFNVGKYYAQRLVRTEMNHFHNEADALAYEEMGIEKYVFVATLDNRTSIMCQENDNEVYDYKDRKVGVNFPPLHPNCRSTTRGYLGEEAEELLKRRARNPITGRNELIDNISYKEWIKKHISFQENQTDNISNNNKIISNDSKANVLNKNIINVSNDVYQAYKTNNFENLAVVTEKGKLLGNITNSNQVGQVSFSQEQLNYMNKYNRELIAIHNHPQEHTFSLKDIYTLFDYDSLSGIIVRTNDYNYYLMPKRDDFEKVKENLSEFKTWFEDNLSICNDEFFIKYPELSNNEHMNLSYKKIFGALEWEYGREKIE